MATIRIKSRSGEKKGDSRDEIRFCKCRWSFMATIYYVRFIIDALKHDLLAQSATRNIGPQRTPRRSALHRERQIITKRIRDASL